MKKKQIKVLALTRHPLTMRQLKELQRIYGNIKLIEFNQRISNVDQILEMCKENNINVLMAVLPLPLLDELLKIIKYENLNIKVIKAVMIRFFVGQIANFQFDHYEEIEKIEIITRRL